MKTYSLILMIFLSFFSGHLLAQKSIAQWLQIAKSGEKNLTNANFIGADLRGINLKGADLSNVQLNGANLSNCDLTDCNFYQTNLSGANLSGANLTRAVLLSSNLRYANLSNSNLTQALIQEADLQFALLTNANLQSSNLLLANLKNADLQNVNLSNAILDYIETPTQASETIFANSQQKKTEKTTALIAPEMVETEALSIALELVEKQPAIFIKLNGAKINKNTKGLDFLWAKKNGAVIVASY